MSFEMDFLPPSFRTAAERQRSRRWTGLMLSTVVAGLLMTEGVLRLRLDGLRGHQTLLKQQSNVAAQRSREIDELQRQQQQSLEELESWSAPLRAQRASVMLDGLLASRLPSMRLRTLEWKCGSLLEEDKAASLRITGSTHRLQELSEFIRIFSEAGGPRLEVRRSGARSLSEDAESQEFVLESAVGRGTRP